MTRLYEIVAPVVTIVSLTALAMIPLLVDRVIEQEQKLTEQEKQITEFHEIFLINCLSGRTMVVGRTEGVKCTKL